MRRHCFENAFAWAYASWRTPEWASRTGRERRDQRRED